LGDDGITAGTAAVAVVQRTHDARDALHLLHIADADAGRYRCGLAVNRLPPLGHVIGCGGRAQPGSDQQLAGLWFGRLITGRVS